MSTIWSAEFWKATAQRMVRGAGIGGLLQLAAQFGDVIQTGAMNAFDLTWALPGYMLGGAVISLLFCLAGNAQSGTGPSFGQSEIVQPAVQVPPAPGAAEARRADGGALA